MAVAILLSIEAGGTGKKTATLNWEFDETITVQKETTVWLCPILRRLPPKGLSLVFTQ